MKHSIRIKQYICKKEDFGGWKQQREEIADHYLMKNRAFVVFFNNTKIPTILEIVLTNEELGKTGMPTLVLQ